MVSYEDTSKYTAEVKIVLFEAIYDLLQDNDYVVNKNNKTVKEYYDETYHTDEVGGLWRIFEKKYNREIMNFIKEKANELQRYTIKKE